MAFCLISQWLNFPNGEKEEDALAETLLVVLYKLKMCTTFELQQKPYFLY